ncbi:hypothetical protein IKS73_01055 [bacterium]|nr:hypothetical protein [bacterium]
MTRFFFLFFLLVLSLIITGCEALDPRNAEDDSAIPWNQPLREEKELDLNPTFNW